MGEARYWIEVGRDGWLRLHHGHPGTSYSTLANVRDVRRMEIAIEDHEERATAHVARAAAMRAALEAFRAAPVQHPPDSTPSGRQGLTE